MLPAGAAVAAIELADGGVAAARSDSGVAASEGNTGAVGVSAVASATTVASLVSFLFLFHQAQRGPPDWQPMRPTIARTTHVQRANRVFMSGSGSCPSVGCR